MKSALKALVALSLLTALLLFVSPHELLREFSALSWPHVVLLLLLSVALVWVSAAKWRLFLGLNAPSTWRLVRLYLVGYFVNSLLPSNVGGDATRSFMAGKRAGQVTAASATILERYTGLVAMLGLGLIASCTPIAASVALPVRLVLVGLVVGLAGATVAVFWARSFAIAQRLLPKRAGDFLSKVRLGLIDGVSNQEILLKAFALSLLYHCLTVLNTAVAAHAVGWTAVPLAQLFVVLPLILTIGALPISPSGLGVQEGAFVYFLALLGASHPEGFAIALILRAKTYLLAVVGWGCFMLEQRAAHTKHAHPDGALVPKSLIDGLAVTGTGRANLVLLVQAACDVENYNFCSTALAEYRVTKITLAHGFERSVLEVVDAVEAELARLGVRSALFVGLGDAASVVQALTLRAPKLVRTMVLIDPSTRPHPTRFLRAIAAIERFLPLGLPFRGPTTRFDALPFVHRLRSPCVIASSSGATGYQRSEAQVLAARLPTAILILEPGRSKITAGVSAELIQECVALLEELPAKAPQKNRAL